MICCSLKSPRPGHLQLPTPNSLYSHTTPISLSSSSRDCPTGSCSFFQDSSISTSWWSLHYPSPSLLLAKVSHFLFCPTKHTSVIIPPLLKKVLESSLGIWTMSCLNLQPQGFKVIKKCALSEMYTAMDEQNLTCILYLPHIIGQFI